MRRIYYTVELRSIVHKVESYVDVPEDIWLIMSNKEKEEFIFESIMEEIEWNYYE